MGRDVAALRKKFPEPKPRAFRRLPDQKLHQILSFFGNRSLVAIHNKTLTLSCRREPERVREIGGEGGIQYSVRKSGIVGVQVGHDTRVVISAAP